MPALEFLYALALAAERDDVPEAARFAPFAYLTFILFGLIHSVLSLGATVLDQSKPLLNPAGFEHWTLGFVISMSFAMPVAWLGFERRKKLISQKFPFIPPISSSALRLGIGGLFIGCGYLIFSSSVDNPGRTVFVSAIVLAVGTIILRKLEISRGQSAE